MFQPADRETEDAHREPEPRTVPKRDWDEITDAELNNVSGGDKATTTKTTTTTTTNTTKNIKNWIELESVQ